GRARLRALRGGRPVHGGLRGVCAPPARAPAHRRRAPVRHPRPARRAPDAATAAPPRPGGARAGGGVFPRGRRGPGPVAARARGLLSADTQVRRRDLAVAVEVMVRRASAAGVAQTLRGLAERPDARPELRDIAVPTLVVVGADDSVTPPASCQAMAALIPGAE